MLETFFAAKQHPIPVMIGSNSDEASVLAVFGVDIAGQIQKCAVSGVLARVNPAALSSSERRRSTRAAGLSGYGIYHVGLCRHASAAADRRTVLALLV